MPRALLLIALSLSARGAVVSVVRSLPVSVVDNGTVAALLDPPVDPDRSAVFFSYKTVEFEPARMHVKATLAPDGTNVTFDSVNDADWVGHAFVVVWERGVEVRHVAGGQSYPLIGDAEQAWVVGSYDRPGSEYDFDDVIRCFPSSNNVPCWGIGVPQTGRMMQVLIYDGAFVTSRIANVPPSAYDDSGDAKLEPPLSFAPNSDTLALVSANAADNIPDNALHPVGALSVSARIEGADVLFHSAGSATELQVAFTAVRFDDGTRVSVVELRFEDDMLEAVGEIPGGAVNLTRSICMLSHSLSRPSAALDAPGASSTVDMAAALFRVRFENATHVAADRSALSAAEQPVACTLRVQVVQWADASSTPFPPAPNPTPPATLGSPTAGGSSATSSRPANEVVTLGTGAGGEGAGGDGGDDGEGTGGGGAGPLVAGVVAALVVCVAVVVCVFVGLRRRRSRRRDDAGRSPYGTRVPELGTVPSSNAEPHAGGGSSSLRSSKRTARSRSASRSGKTRGEASNEYERVTLAPGGGGGNQYDSATLQAGGPTAKMAYNESSFSGQSQPAYNLSSFSDL